MNNKSEGDASKCVVNDFDLVTSKYWRVPLTSTQAIQKPQCC